MSTSAPRPDQPSSRDLGVDGRSGLDDDPTGIRALLAALPDPGPMPASLVERITSSLAAEQERRTGSVHLRAAPSTEHLSQGAGAAAADRPSGVADRPRPGHPDQSSTRPTGRPHRRWQRADHAGATPVRAGRRGTRWQQPLLTVAGLAAAAVLVGTLGHTILTNSGITSGSSSDVGAAAMSSGSAAASGSASTSLSPARRAAAGAAGGEKGSASGPAPRVTMTGTAYSAQTLATGAAQLLTSPRRTLTPTAAEAPSIGPIATPTGARACLDALGVPRGEATTIDLATYAGRPAAVVVAATPSGGHQAYAVARSCSTGHPDVLHDAVTVP